MLDSYLPFPIGRPNQYRIALVTFNEALEDANVFPEELLNSRQIYHLIGNWVQKL